MAHTRAPLFSAAVLTVAAVLIGNNAGCGSQTVTTLYKVGGTVTGLTGTLKLSNNGGDTLTLTAPGAFQFATGLKKGAAYDVAISEAPTGQVCTVSDGQGTVGTEDVSSVVVTCSEASYTLGGTVSGLTGSLVLANGSATVNVVSGGTAFTFADPLAQGAPYSVTVKTQPSGQRCDVTGGSGSIAGANVTSVKVACQTTHAIKVHVTNLTDDSVAFTSNTNEVVSIAYDPANSTNVYDASFTTPIVAGDAYKVTVTRNPQTPDGYGTIEVCTPAVSSGTAGDGDVTINISCARAHLLSVVVERDSASIAIDVSDGKSGADIQSTDSTNTQVNGDFTHYYADGEAFTATLVEGAGCIACPVTGQQQAGTTLTGTFNGSDITVTWSCASSNPVCPAVN